jgi:hypothetical protein
MHIFHADLGTLPVMGGQHDLAVISTGIACGRVAASRALTYRRRRRPQQYIRTQQLAASLNHFVAAGGPRGWRFQSEHNVPGRQPVAMARPLCSDAVNRISTTVTKITAT